ncbi:hypothetical protein H6F90_29670 [Trichocoleus sp. FACHB-591]|uniref:hypothetical protein n=1 Tax=Trichocoleus sp. FACHB-591 TaxID=2692872 RepID=UPI00168214C2|nr:hypothetical protein [Trichocoleus sp. FACHB-591]MBD2099236.1 hypothetical protein [Trichocoleus sp. FACHB-591]
MSTPESEQFVPFLSPPEMECITHLSQQYGTPVPKLIEQLHRNRVEAQLVSAIEGITVEDFYSRTIAQIRAQLTEFE